MKIPLSHPIRIDRRDSATIVTINNAKRMNALSQSVVASLLSILEEINDDPSVRAVIITGDGPKAFCAGADLKERAGMTAAQVRRFLRDLRLIMARIEGLSKPVIAAINGFAFGGGLELALACDIRIAAKTAFMGLTEVRLGIIPGAGGTQRLPRIVGFAKAKELILTGRRVSAKTAYQIGLITGSFESENLLNEAIVLAEEMALAAPLALRQAKFAIQQGINVDLNTGLELEQKAYEVLLPSEDRLEALAAFKERRAPAFKGR